MPKQVDREARRREVVDALFRVVVRDGLQRASLRAVADEARLNIGSVRHYFASQQELMQFAMESMTARVADRLLRRVSAIGDLGQVPGGQLLEHAEELLCELLPLDAERRSEVTVFIDFFTAARTDPGLEELSRQTASDTRFLVRRVLDRLAADGTLYPGAELATETERLMALLDGLSFNAVLRPELLTPATCRAALRAHLQQLAATT